MGACMDHHTKNTKETSANDAFGAMLVQRSDKLALNNCPIHKGFDGKLLLLPKFL